VLVGSDQPRSRNRASIEVVNMFWITAGPDFVRSKHNASTKYTPSLEGKARHRRSSRSLMASASSTSSGGTSRATKPSLAWDNT